MNATSLPGFNKIEPWPQEEDWISFNRLVKKVAGVDLNAYKQDQIRRRVSDLTVREGYRSLFKLAKQLESDPPSRDWFIDRLSITVTSMYRDPDRWRYLEKVLLPSLDSKQEPVRVWCAGCAYGAEAVATACMLETAGLDYSIFATDLDRRSLSKAELGQFSASDVENLPKEFLSKFFTPMGDKFQANSILMEKIEYRRENLLECKGKSEFNLIICRNVMIYFSALAKETLLQNIVDQLKSGGILFLGTTEKIVQADHYRLVPIRNDFYRKLGYD